MRIEVSFLRSAVARRVFWVLLLAAGTPLLLFAALSYTSLSGHLQAQEAARQQDSAKYSALRVYDRLVAGQTSLASLATASRDDTHPTDRVSLAARDLFRGVATVHHESLQVEGHADVAALWTKLAGSGRFQGAAAKRRLWWLPADATHDARVIVGVRSPTHWWLAELEPEFLWGDLRDRDAAAQTCVADAQAAPLLCATGIAAPAAGEQVVRWSLFMGGDFGAGDWMFTRRSPAATAVAGALPVERMAWQGALATLLLVGVLSLVMVRRTTVPLERLIDGTRRLARREWTARVPLQSSDEFGELARSFNDMAERIGRQVEAMQVQSEIDREILSGLDLDRVLRQVLARMRSLLPRARLGLLVAPQAAGRWRLATAERPEGTDLAVDPELLAALQSPSQPLRGQAGRTVAAMLAAGGAGAGPSDAVARRPRMTVPGDGASAVRSLVATWQDRAVAVLLVATAEGEPVDEDTERELHELRDRVAVTLAAVARERVLRDRAVHDSLTGLLNRAGLLEQLDQLAAAGDRAAFVLLYVDLDGFKEVNDSLGHPSGDQLLCEVAGLLRAAAPSALAVARPGGDEFVLLVAATRAQADALAAALCRRLSEPFRVAGQPVQIGASIGLAHCPDDGRDRIELMRRADLAMYAAKARGRGRHAWFEAALDERAAERAWLQRELQHGISQGQLELYYQPRVRAADGRLSSVEALVRWNHPVRGLMAPGQFVPLAEEMGLIEPLGRWVMGEACRQLAAWRAAGVPVPRVAVNVSALQLQRANFADEVLGVVRLHGLQPPEIEVELTESLFAGDPDAVCALLQPLRDAGMLLALDDFGTGYASLSSLYRLPLAVLKIDRSFVCDLGQRESADAVARSILALARALDKHVVAEGVETEAQRRRLLALGCDELQGYLFARPLTVPALEAYLEREAAPA